VGVALAELVGEAAARSGPARVKAQGKIIYRRKKCFLKSYNYFKCQASCKKSEMVTGGGYKQLGGDSAALELYRSEPDLKNGPGWIVAGYWNDLAEYYNAYILVRAVCMAV
jgi:hypothetical protein